MSDNPDKPKIIVDEDWKSQVQAEKAAARQASDKPSTGAAPATEADVPLPSASLSFLLTTIATQAMIALGQAPNPITGKFEPRPQLAKHHIDTLAMLDEKTAGNRTPDESAMLSELLHQLRMAYVMLLNAPADAASKEAMPG